MKFLTVLLGFLGAQSRKDDVLKVTKDSPPTPNTCPNPTLPDYAAITCSPPTVPAPSWRGLRDVWLMTPAPTPTRPDVSFHSKSLTRNWF
ncbi:hypothetical protein J6590_036412 [Homalodisca vitripennis]|nr:hypothetical protein J6590_036412 [Homalodisca vitripennis]